MSPALSPALKRYKSLVITLRQLVEEEEDVHAIMRTEIQSDLTVVDLAGTKHP